MHMLWQASHFGIPLTTFTPNEGSIDESSHADSLTVGRVVDYVAYDKRNLNDSRKPFQENLLSTDYVIYETSSMTFFYWYKRLTKLH